MEPIGLTLKDKSFSSLSELSLDVYTNSLITEFVKEVNKQKTGKVRVKNFKPIVKVSIQKNNNSNNYLSTRYIIDLNTETTKGYLYTTKKIINEDYLLGFYINKLNEQIEDTRNIFWNKEF
jgi:predicted RND superfamily exporter protein